MAANKKLLTEPLSSKNISEEIDLAFPNFLTASSLLKEAELEPGAGFRLKKICIGQVISNIILLHLLT